MARRVPVAGIIGGLGPESTVDYYTSILRRFRERDRAPRSAGYAPRSGGYAERNPELLIASVDIHAMLALVEARDFGAMENFLLDAVGRLARGGADFAAIACNTAHVVFDGVAAKSPIPLVSIVDSACGLMRSAGRRRALLTGTAFTMGEGFYAERAQAMGIEIVAPEKADREAIQDVIFPELEEGIVVPEKKARFVEIANRYAREAGIDSVILGCTELPLMIGDGDLAVATVNPSAAHVEAIVGALLNPR